MAKVPELNDISMDSYSEEEFYGDYSCEKNEIAKKCDSHLEWESSNSDWSNLRMDPIREIKRPRKCCGFRKAVMIVVIVEKLKGVKGSERQCMFNDFDLLNDILVEEECSINIQERTSVQPKFTFNYSEVYMIRDSRGKCMTLREYEGNAHLLALYLQNGNLESEANISMGFYRSAPFDGEKAPVTLAIKGRDLYLTCVAEGDHTVLCLKSVTDIKEKKGYDLLPFLFYKRQNSSINTFESVAFPGWYISTSQYANQFVQVQPGNDQQHIREFLITKTA